MIVARGNKTGTLYMSSSLRNKLADVDAGANSSLWHSRLGDTSKKGMKMLVPNGKLPELKIVEHKFCETVFFGNQKKVNFSKEVREPKSTDLELVHTDVCGLSPVTSLGDHSRYYGLLLTIRAGNFRYIF
ncbi:uncharacterized mitochondrial protein AtMg00300-like [Primulina eburnea]|uniref:uncharacterized mitochondrial protein AtMg00300-like n=1 Tax=Primulina eburnea TaxID=1245227 RepID=UPI003C6C66DB